MGWGYRETKPPRGRQNGPYDLRKTKGLRRASQVRETHHPKEREANLNCPSPSLAYSLSIHRQQHPWSLWQPMARNLSQGQIHLCPPLQEGCLLSRREAQAQSPWPRWLKPYPRADTGLLTLAKGAIIATGSSLASHSWPQLPGLSKRFRVKVSHPKVPSDKLKHNKVILWFKK